MLESRKTSDSFPQRIMISLEQLADCRVCQLDQPPAIGCDRSSRGKMAQEIPDARACAAGNP